MLNLASCFVRPKLHVTLQSKDSRTIVNNILSTLLSEETRKAHKNTNVDFYILKARRIVQAHLRRICWFIFASLHLCKEKGYNPWSSLLHVKAPFRADPQKEAFGCCL